MLSYPQGKEEAGPAYWATLHNAATQLPEKLDVVDKNEFVRWLKQTIDYFPCKIPCRDNAKKYIKKNSPYKIKTRKDAMDYLCKFHNSVRREQGKEEYNCEALYNPNPDASCPHCQYEINKDVRGAMQTFKNANVRLIRELCKREGLPMPEIVWSPCPEAPETSCNIVLKDSNTGRILRRPIIYLNPSTVSLRQTIHEIRHYITTMLGKHINAHDEQLIEEETQRIIRNEFPQDMKKLKYEDTIPFDRQMYKDSFSYGLNNPDDGTLDDRLNRNFPRYAEMIRREKAKNGNATVSVNTETDRDGGFLAIFDDIFKPLGEWMGLPARAVNEAHMSALIGNIITTIQETHLSVWGNVVASSISGIAMWAATVLMKNSLAKSDRNLLNLTGAFLVYHNLHMLANPSLQPFALTDARLAGQALQEGDFNTFLQTMIDDRYRVASIVVPVSRAGADTTRAGAQSAAEQLRAGAQTNLEARQSIGITSPTGTISSAEQQRQTSLQQAVNTGQISLQQAILRGFNPSAPIPPSGGGGGGGIPSGGGVGAIGGGGLPIAGGRGGGSIPGPSATAGAGPFFQGPGLGRPPFTIGFGPGGIQPGPTDEYQRQQFRGRIPRRRTRTGAQQSPYGDEDFLDQTYDEDPYLAALRESGGIDSSAFLPGGSFAGAGRSLNNIGTGYNSVPFDEDERY